MTPQIKDFRVTHTPPHPDKPFYVSRHNPGPVGADQYEYLHSDGVWRRFAKPISPSHCVQTAAYYASEAAAQLAIDRYERSKS